jgi:hypothetical protein
LSSESGDPKGEDIPSSDESIVSQKHTASIIATQEYRCAHQEYTEGSYLLARGRKGERRLSEGSGDFRGLSGQCRGLWRRIESRGDLVMVL